MSSLNSIEMSNILINLAFLISKLSVQLLNIETDRNVSAYFSVILIRLHSCHHSSFSFLLPPLNSCFLIVHLHPRPTPPASSSPLHIACFLFVSCLFVQPLAAEQLLMSSLMNVSRQLEGGMEGCEDGGEATRDSVSILCLSFTSFSPLFLLLVSHPPSLHCSIPPSCSRLFFLSFHHFESFSVLSFLLLPFLNSLFLFLT